MWVFRSRILTNGSRPIANRPQVNNLPHINMKQCAENGELQNQVDLTADTATAGSNERDQFQRLRRRDLLLDPRKRINELQARAV